MRGVGNRGRPRITPNNVHRGEAEGKLSEGPEWGEGGGAVPAEKGRGGPLCGSLTDNGLIRLDVALERPRLSKQTDRTLRRWT